MKNPYKDWSWGLLFYPTPKILKLSSDEALLASAGAAASRSWLARHPQAETFRPHLRRPQRTSTPLQVCCLDRPDGLVRPIETTYKVVKPDGAHVAVVAEESSSNRREDRAESAIRLDLDDLIALL